MNVVPANIRWQLLPEPSGKFCQNSLATLAINHEAATRDGSRGCGYRRLPVRRSSDRNRFRRYIQRFHRDTELLQERLEVVQRTGAVILGGICP